MSKIIMCLAEHRFSFWNFTDSQLNFLKLIMKGDFIVHMMKGGGNEINFLVKLGPYNRESKTQ